MVSDDYFQFRNAKFSHFFWYLTTKWCVCDRVNNSLPKLSILSVYLFWPLSWWEHLSNCHIESQVLRVVCVCVREPWDLVVPTLPVWQEAYFVTSNISTWKFCLQRRALGEGNAACQNSRNKIGWRCLVNKPSSSSFKEGLVAPNCKLLQGQAQCRKPLALVHPLQAARSMPDKGEHLPSVSGSLRYSKVLSLTLCWKWPESLWALSKCWVLFCSKCNS